MPTHDEFMRRALGLAARARGCTAPNPMVGSVVVKDDVVVGEGWHRQAGAAHAEVEAIADAGELARGATLYATLEPCSHHGRTPPCVDAILAAGIRHVVYALADPNPAAAGGGTALRRAGVEVTEGVEEAAARDLNRFFLHQVKTGRPRVILKSASSLDGRVATRTGQSRWISGPASRRRVHELRQAVDGILVGVDTVIADDPSLTVRLDTSALSPEDVRHPRPIVVDSRGRLPLDCRLLQHPAKRTPLVATTAAMLTTKQDALRNAGCEVIVFDADSTTDRVSLPQLVQYLGALGMQSVLVEGGPNVHGAFLDAELVDEAWCFLAPMLIGGEASRSSIGGLGAAHLTDAWRLSEPRIERLDGDVLIRGDVIRVPEAVDRTQADSRRSPATLVTGQQAASICQETE